MNDPAGHVSPDGFLARNTRYRNQIWQVVVCDPGRILGKRCDQNSCEKDAYVGAVRI